MKQTTLKIMPLLFLCQPLLEFCKLFHINVSVECLQVQCIFCRGVPFPVVCKNKSERIAAIGDAIADANYHIVALQEVCLHSVQCNR